MKYDSVALLHAFHNVHHNKYEYPEDLSNQKVTETIAIFCPVKGHGVFYQKITHHLEGRGCPKCGRLKTLQALAVDRSTWINRFEEVHGRGKYDYSGIPAAPKSNEKYPIRCIEHDLVFYQSPNQHWKRKRGCPKCGKTVSWESRKNCRIDRQSFIQKAQLKNGFGYEYINLPKEFSLSDTIGIFCSAHKRLFFCTGHDHLEGKGCSAC